MWLHMLLGNGIYNSLVSSNVKLAWFICDTKIVTSTEILSCTLYFSALNLVLLNIFVPKKASYLSRNDKMHYISSV